MNRISKEYISKTKALFSTWGKSEKKYLQNLQLIIEDYCKEKNLFFECPLSGIWHSG